MASLSYLYRGIFFGLRFFIGIPDYQFPIDRIKDWLK